VAISVSMWHVLGVKNTDATVMLYVNFIKNSKGLHGYEENFVVQ
jgi:hypothetical protein